MKAVVRRLRQLERRLAPQTEAPYSRSLSLAMVIRERRRRRCEASGEPFEELPAPPMRVAPGRCLSCAETLRLARHRASEQKLRAAGSAQIASDIWRYRATRCVLAPRGRSVGYLARSAACPVRCIGDNTSSDQCIDDDKKG